MNWPDDYLNKTICGDCRKVMRGIPDGSVDLILTDPPYNLGKNYGGFSSDRLPEKKYWKWMKEVMSECYRVLGDGYCYVFNTDLGIFKLKPIMEKIGFTFRQLLIWYGKNGYGIRLKFGWAYRHEPFLMFTKGKADPLIGGKGLRWYTSVFEYPRPQSNFRARRP